VTLKVVPTPLGNLQDITARALTALKEADVILCEDTRRTRQLASHFGITAPLVRYNEFDDRSVGHALAQVREGKKVALVSDGGTPALSDPGRKLVAAARKEGLAVESLPGPFAGAAAVAGSGLPGDQFVFLGFLPRSPGKQRRALEEAGKLEKTIVVYESPYRVVKLLQLVEQVFGPDSQAVVARELSKLHEEWISGTVKEVREKLAAKPSILGEFVIVLNPAAKPE
jgi:16S rRNA (cytidine1402-2'-O)-methyltransferase